MQPQGLDHDRARVLLVSVAHSGAEQGDPLPVMITPDVCDRLALGDQVRLARFLEIVAHVVTERQRRVGSRGRYTSCPFRIRCVGQSEPAVSVLATLVWGADEVIRISVETIAVGLLRGAPHRRGRLVARPSPPRCCNFGTEFRL